MVNLYTIGGRGQLKSCCFAPTQFKFRGFVALNFEILQLSASANYYEELETNNHIKRDLRQTLQHHSVKTGKIQEHLSPTSIKIH
jgi:hypothetical protein